MGFAEPTTNSATIIIYLIVNVVKPVAFYIKSSGKSSDI